MSLITLIITLVIIGVILWAVNTYIPMDGKIKRILNIAVAVGVVIWLCTVFGVCSHVKDVNVPSL